MQDELTGATSTPAEEISVRADLEAAWNAAEAGETGAADTGAAPAADAGKAAPTAAEQAAAEALARDERGRFTKKEGESEAPGAAAAETGAAPAVDPAAAALAGGAPQVVDPAAQAVAGRPPPGWSVQSKAAWDGLPDHIRADIAKREEEVSSGFAQYAGVKPYADMARESGTTLPEALGRYVNMEQLLRKDFKQGIFAIAQNMGVTPQQFQQMFGGAAPAATPHQNGQPAAATDPALGDLDDPYVKAAVNGALAPVLQRMDALQTTIQDRQLAEQNREVANAEKVVNEFRSSDKYRYFSNVEKTINRLIESRMIDFTGDYRADLAAAYEMACQLQPEVRDALIKERIAAADAEKAAAATKAEADKRAKAEAARKAGLSVRGAPSGPVSAPGGSKGTVRADLEAAWDAHS